MNADGNNNPTCSHDHETQLSYLPFKRYGIFGKDAKMPTKKTFGAAGIDLYTVRNEIFPSETVRVLPTGLTVSIPKGYYGKITDCSTLASMGLHVLAGTHDSDYNGEIFVTVANLHSRDVSPVRLLKGDKLCQMVIHKYESMVPVLVDQSSWRASTDCNVQHYKAGMGLDNTDILSLRECSREQIDKASEESDERD